MSVARNNVNKLRDIVSVRDFGAIGDGVVNDTASIQAAVSYAVTNSLPLNFPSGVYLCAALTVPSSGDLIWIADGSAEIKCTGTDVTLISPTGNVQCRGLKFTDYMIGFNFASIASGKTISFVECVVSNCGTINTAGGRVDFQGFITNKNASSNTIARLEVIDCSFTGDDFCIAWQGKLNEALVANCSFSTVRRIAVMIGLEASGRTAKDCENIKITNCTFRNIIANDAAEFEIHAVLVYGYRVIVAANVVDTCYDIHSSTHDSEAIYVKAVMATISDNIVQDGGRGDGMITVKGAAIADEPEDVTGANVSKYCLVSHNVLNISDDFYSLYGVIFSAVYTQGSRIDVKNNTISGTYDRAIAANASGHIDGNAINGACTYGVLVSFLQSTDQTFTRVTNNTVEMLGVSAAGISVRLAATTAMTLPLVQIDNNAVRYGAAATLSGEQAAISLRVDRVSAGNNTITSAQINNNLLQGATAQPNGISLLTAAAGTGNNGVISTAHIVGNSGNLLDNAVRLDGSAGDVAYLHVADCTFQNVSNSVLSNPGNATATKVRNIRGNRVLTNSGTATITSANTEVTVTMGIQSNMRPTTFDLISVRPTNNLGAATKWWIDTLSGDTFKIKVNTAPGGSDTATFAWEAKNQYYY